MIDNLWFYGLYLTVTTIYGSIMYSRGLARGSQVMAAIIVEIRLAPSLGALLDMITKHQETKEE
jgi:hypothetical protein